MSEKRDAVSTGRLEPTGKIGTVAVGADLRDDFPDEQYL